VQDALQDLRDRGIDTAGAEAPAELRAHLRDCARCAEFARFLEESMALFARDQDQLRQSLGADPLEAMGKLAQRNLELWNSIQDSFFKAAGFGGPPGAKSAAEPGDKKPG
jgi:hypothetical protein